MKLPTAWTALTEPRRRILWNLAHRPMMTVTPFSLSVANKRVLTALAVDGLARHTLELDVFYVRAPPAGRLPVEQVDSLVAHETSRQLWAWLRYGAGLQTRADF